MIKNGKTIIPSNASPWPHEIRVAKVLSKAGYTVEFIANSNTSKTPDIWLNGVPYEIKSPVSNNIKAVERNLKRANKQSKNIIFDSSRMKRIPDSKIVASIKYRLNHQNTINEVIFINKYQEIIYLKNK